MQIESEQINNSDGVDYNQNINIQMQIESNRNDVDER